MAAHGICFDFYYRPKPSQIGQNSSAAAADTRLAQLRIHIVDSTMNMTRKKYNAPPDGGFTIPRICTLLFLAVLLTADKSFTAFLMQNKASSKLILLNPEIECLKTLKQSKQSILRLTFFKTNPVESRNRILAYRTLGQSKQSRLHVNFFRN